MRPCHNKLLAGEPCNGRFKTIFCKALLDELLRICREEVEVWAVLVWVQHKRRQHVEHLQDGGAVALDMPVVGAVAAGAGVAGGWVVAVRAVDDSGC
eukprot:305003-Chlamydomonas_euryale.AAC.1